MKTIKLVLPYRLGWDVYCNTVRGFLPGRTVVFLFTDGSYGQMPGSRRPVEIAKGLADKYNICFYVISTAEGDIEKSV